MNSFFGLTVQGGMFTPLESPLLSNGVNSIKVY
jgi:hypothetical protein